MAENTLTFKVKVDKAGFKSGMSAIESDAKNASAEIKGTAKSTSSSVKASTSGVSSKVKTEANKAESSVNSATKQIKEGANSAASTVKKESAEASSKVKNEAEGAGKRTRDEMHQTGTHGESVFKKLAASIVAAFSVQSVIDFGKQCIDTYSQIEQNESKLRTIMKNRMGSTDKEIASVNKLMKAESQRGVVSTNAQRGGAQQLATFLKSEKALKSLIPAMNDLGAQQKGVNASSEDMVNYANMIGKVMNGQTGALKRVGISFDESQEKAMKYGSEQERAAALAQVLEQNVGGVNKKLAQTDSGKMVQAKHNINDLKASIGKDLMPVAGDMAKKATGFVGWLANTGIPTIKRLAPAIAIAAGAVGAFFLAFNIVKLKNELADAESDIRKFFAMVSANPAILIAAAIAAVTIALVELYRHNKKFRNFVNKMFAEIRAAFGPLIDLIKQGISSITSHFQTHSNTWKAIGNVLLTILKVYIQIIVDSIRIAATVITAVVYAIIAVVKFVIAFVKGVVSVVQTVVNAIVTFVKWCASGVIAAVNGIKTGVSYVINGIKIVINAFLSFFRGIGQGIQSVCASIGGFFRSVGGVISGAWSGIKNACSAGAHKVHDIISDLGHKIGDAFDGLPGKFLNWGRDMMKNLKEGITRGVKKVKDKLSDLLGWIKDRFHFSTPDKGPLAEFDKWAPDMMATMASGIEKGSSKVKAAMHDLADDTAQSVKTITIKPSVQIDSSVKTAQADQSISGEQKAPAENVQKAIADVQTTLTNEQQPLQAASDLTFQTVDTAAENKTTAAKNTANSNVTAVRTFVTQQTAPFYANSYTFFNQFALAANNRFTYARNLSWARISTIISNTNSRRGEFYNAGVFTIQGFVDGMNAERAAVVNTSNSLVQAVKDAFVKGLGIHSPARFTVWAGENTGLGYIKGMKAIDLGGFARHTVGTIKDAFKGLRFSADANVNWLGDDALKEVAWMRKYDGGSVVNGADGGKGNRFVQNMLNLVNDDRHGYSQARRWGPDYDCSSSIITALRWAGFNTGSASYTGNMASELGKHGWNRMAYRNPLKGDILLDPARHVELAIGGFKNAAFHSAHGHPETGDQAHEAYVGRDPGHWPMMLRYKNGFGDSLADVIEEAYNIKKYGYGRADAEGDGGGDTAQGGLADWVRTALTITGQPMSLLNGLIRAAKSESGGNPRAINNWDINARLGHPSKGLMQTIDRTFQAFKLPGHGNIYNPVDNLIASIRYMIAKYGSVQNVLRPRARHWYGYAVGSRYITRDQLAQLHEGEAVIRADENPYKNSKGGFITPLLEKIVYSEMSKIAARAADGISINAKTTGGTTDDKDIKFTQVVNFDKTPESPSEMRAALRMEGRRLAFGR